jgi:hypothetical protein
MSEILQREIPWLVKASKKPFLPTEGSSLLSSRLIGGLNFASIEDDV